MSEALLKRLFDDAQSSRLGSGWISGTASVFLGTLALGGVAASALAFPGLTRVIGSLPWLVQLLLIIPVADLSHYAAHRAFHRVPVLWRFHRVHHSVETMDWLAGSRLHLVDVILTRGLVLVPIALMGFTRSVVFAYLVFVAVHAVFIHANFAPSPRWLERVIVLPRFHHWHHAADARAVDRNFAVHLPIIDAVFGTRYLPESAWPDRLGLLGERAPGGFFAQLLWPFTR